MPLSLEQYAKFLDGRSDLLWPAVPPVQRAKATPHLSRLADIRVVTFSVYGTLLAISGGELSLVHPQDFILEAALEKTIQEFKMWQSMSRKPGKPSEYMRNMYLKLMEELRIARAQSGERNPELCSNELWKLILQRLVKNEYQYDAPFYGSDDEFCEKVSYFFHCSMQGTGPQAGALETLVRLRDRGLALGLLADGQCFTTVQLLRGLARQGTLNRLSDLFDSELIVLSFEVIARKPSERVYRGLIAKLAARGIAPNQVLHVGANLPNDLVPARRLGFRTALYAGDQSSVVANREQLRDATTRPDVLITELGQIPKVIAQDPCRLP